MLRRMRRLRPGCSGLLFLAACAAPAAPPPAVVAGEPALTVDGNLPRPARLSLQDLEALGAEDVPWTFRDAVHVYRGVALDKVLSHLGFEAGGGGRSLPTRERRPGWRNVVIASAGDGFYSVFTCAELMPEMGATRAFVVWSRDGAALPADEGTLRIVVTTDRKGSRSVRMLTGLCVVEVRSQGGSGGR